LECLARRRAKKQKERARARGGEIASQYKSLLLIHLLSRIRANALLLCCVFMVLRLAWLGSTQVALQSFATQGIVAISLMHKLLHLKVQPINYHYKAQTEWKNECIPRKIQLCIFIVCSGWRACTFSRKSASHAIYNSTDNIDKYD
jgi:hypothetical protein